MAGAAGVGAHLLQEAGHGCGYLRRLRPAGGGVVQVDDPGRPFVEMDHRGRHFGLQVSSSAFARRLPSACAADRPAKRGYLITGRAAPPAPTACLLQQRNGSVQPVHSPLSLQVPSRMITPPHLLSRQRRPGDQDIRWSRREARGRVRLSEKRAPTAPRGRAGEPPRVASACSSEPMRPPILSRR